MKKILITILIFSIILAISGCQNENSRLQNKVDAENQSTSIKNKELLEYHISYSEVIGFDEMVSLYEPIDENIKLVYGSEDVTSFYEKYIQSRELLMDEPEDGNALLFVQFKGDRGSALAYSISEVYTYGNELTVEVDEGGLFEISPVEGFNGYFSYVIILEINRKDIEDGIKLNLRITE